MAHLCPRSSNRLLYKRAGFNNARACKRAYNRAAAQSGVILLVILLFLLLTTEAQNAHNGGTDLVVGAPLTLDSGFAGDQRANVSNVTVNDNTWIPKTTETTTTTTVDGPYAKTCILPAAELRWAKNDATPTGAVNEAESIQPKDTGQFYRQVDCKYLYNLDVSGLSGGGVHGLGSYRRHESPGAGDVRPEVDTSHK